jgi:hypothetical protein
MEKPATVNMGATPRKSFFVFNHTICGAHRQSRKAVNIATTDTQKTPRMLLPYPA